MMHIILTNALQLVLAHHPLRPFETSVVNVTWPYALDGSWLPEQENGTVPLQIDFLELLERREQVILDYSNAVPHPALVAIRDGKSPGTMPGLSILFLTVRGLDHASVWGRWFEDGFKWLEEMGYDTIDWSQKETPTVSPSTNLLSRRLQEDSTQNTSTDPIIISTDLPSSTLSGSTSSGSVSTSSGSVSTSSESIPISASSKSTLTRFILNTTTITSYSERRHPSHILQGFVSYPPWMSRDTVKLFIPWMLQPGLIEKPRFCSWSNTNVCGENLLRSAYYDSDQAEWFGTASSDTIPLMKFEDLYKHLLEERRSRYDWAYLNFYNGLPKAHGWQIWSRAVAKTMLDYPENWTTTGLVYSSVMRTVAGSDESASFGPPLRVFGESFFTMTAPETPCFSDSFCDSVMAACWTSECPLDGDLIGVAPATFASIRSSILGSLIRTNGTFFLRKVVGDALVTQCPYADYIKVVPPTYLDDSTADSILAATREKLYTDNPTGNCSITDYLSKMLNFKSDYLWNHPEGYEKTLRLPQNYHQANSLEAIVEFVKPLNIKGFVDPLR